MLVHRPGLKNIQGLVANAGNFEFENTAVKAYAKQQQVKAIHRCDGMEDFRPLTGAAAMGLQVLQPSHHSLTIYLLTPIFAL
ncbi:uncharacterized protein HD556DRAFT_1445429 [Suillus plorans]|uniref:Uncharacterized protein n=1 Tax=Suillus plorans TaxID=116603 RepID=A0A9P7ALU6_9AGAM|nr:uncharacterized protein HD556DRAFT_1445429 [Suillus plorans]KAG1791172.1 hypothetical protein HD556DRAFT_1445429 [Suillus plorans]